MTRSGDDYIPPARHLSLSCCDQGPEPMADFSWIADIARVAAVVGLTATGRQDAVLDPEVDLALVMAVDVSRSMNDRELRAQRDGYANALRHPDIASSIETGAHGRIAVAYMEWAGPDYQKVIVPWTVLATREDAIAFADVLSAKPPTSGAGTSISGGLAAAAVLFAKGGWIGARRVIDVSGDGPNNAGAPIAPVRDLLLDNGITINGLAMALPGHGHADLTDGFGPGNLEAYYEACVVGGPDAFVISVDDIDQFGEAIRRKLVSEIAALQLPLVWTSFRPPSPWGIDCLAIGPAPGR
jgi:hypothetical protein